MNIAEYNTLVFDCDGVVLDSNKVKTDAFYTVGLPFGEKYAQALVDYHVLRGGISRYEKFRYFRDEILPSGADLDELLDAYANEVRSGLMACKIVNGLKELREITKGSRWLIVSGGDQAELNDVFAARGIAGLFDGGIFGSPDNKVEIISRELIAGNIRNPALFIGDSKYDYEASHPQGLDFVFVHNWTEVDDWRDFVAEHSLRYLPSIADLN